MATKANRGSRANLNFQVANSTIGSFRFSNVRQWTVRMERDVIAATNNDSLGWRELVGVDSHSTANPDTKSQGQRHWTFECEAIYSLSTKGTGASTGQSAQPFDRKEIMRSMLSDNALVGVSINLGSDPGSTGVSSWATLSANATVRGYVENVEVGGTYDAPVLYDLKIRGNGGFTGL